MKNKTKKQTLELPPAKAKTLQTALKPVLRQLGLQPHLMSFSVVVAKGGRLSIEFQQRRSNFTHEDVELAIFWGKFPRGMTALDLAAIPADSSKRKNETALHLALSRGLLPPKTTLEDLLECRGKNRRRAIYALFDDYKMTPIFPTYLSAQILAGIKSNSGGSLLHKAAIRGIFPRNTTVQDLLAPPDQYGMSPLHRAAQAGHLLPCTKKILTSLANKDGHTPWWFAVEKFNNPFDPEASVRNILACPELAQRLRPNRKDHQDILDRLLASPGLTPEIRNQLAKFPQICAAML